MDCQQAELLLLDQLECGLAGDTAGAFQAHLSDCLECRLKLQETSAVLRALRCDDPGSSAAEPGRLHAGLGPMALRLTDYEIEEEIGRGGMAVVYRARQRALNRTVALKILGGPLLSARAIHRFSNEGRTAARLKHPHIVPIYDQGRLSGGYYLAMELVEGQTLSQMLGRQQRSTAAKAPNYRRIATDFAALADALQHAHDQRIVHRDIKPQNILVGVDGRYRIADFGLARVLEDPGVTMTGDVLGTPAYMAPEQADGCCTADARSDIYSLGATLYEVLTLRRPFGGRNANQLLHQIKTCDPRPPRQLDRRIPVDLETICLRALHKEPSRRFQRAADLGADLRRFLEHRPIRSRRTPWPARLGRWARRHPAITTFMLAASAAVSVGAHQLRASAAERVRSAWAQLAFQDYRRPAAALALLERRWGVDDVQSELATALAFLPISAATALEHVDQALADEPQNVTAWYLKAWALSGQGRKVPARRALEQADALCAAEPPLAEQWFLRGQAILSIGGQHQTEQAIACYDQAIRLRADYPQAMLHQARAMNWRLYHQRRPELIDESVSRLQGVARLRPHSGYPHYLLSIAYHLASQIDPARSAEYFDTAVHHARLAQADPEGAANGHLAEAYCHEGRGDYAAAIEHYDLADAAEGRCAAAERRRHLVYRYRWRNHYWAGQTSAALDDLESAVAAIPDVSSCDDLIGLWLAGPLRDLLRREFGGEPVPSDDPVRQALHTRREPAAILAEAAGFWLVGDAGAARDCLDAAREHADWEAVLFPYESSEWNRALVAFGLGEVTLATVLRLAEQLQPDDPTWLRAQVYFFDGLRLLAAGRRAPALAQLQAAAACRDFQRYEYLATLLINRMGSAPDWPMSAWADAAD